MVLPPGSTIGILGGGQLGRMMALAAARLGYRCHILDPHEQPCAAEVSAEFTRAAYDDREALRRFAEQCDVITYEFENIPVEPLAVLGDKLAPSTRSLEVAQDRAAEKRFIEGCGVRVAPWREVDCAADIEAALEALGSPILLKSRRYGYDGKGQAWVLRAGEQPERRRIQGSAFREPGPARLPGFAWTERACRQARQAAPPECSRIRR